MSSFPTSCVVDASVAIKLFLPEQHSEEVEAFFASRFSQPDSGLHVPDLLFIECANVFWKKIRRGEHDAVKAAADLATLRGFRLPTTATSELMESALQIACAHDVSAYDACYLALAEAKAVPLLTADKRLADKFAGGPYEVVALCQLA